jgi:hypothetical protein
MAFLFANMNMNAVYLPDSWMAYRGAALRASGRISGTRSPRQSPGPAICLPASQIGYLYLFLDVDLPREPLSPAYGEATICLQGAIVRCQLVCACLRGYDFRSRGDCSILASAS